MINGGASETFMVSYLSILSSLTLVCRLMISQTQRTKVFWGLISMEKQQKPFDVYHIANVSPVLSETFLLFMSDIIFDLLFN